MIELILYGASGFLLAALLAFLIVPVLIDRAAKNATRKLKANLPFSTDEMEADKDQLKAAHAVELRKVEISLTRAKDRLTSQDIELRTLREQLEGSNKIGKASKLAMEEMRQKEETLNAKLREGDTKFASLEARIRQLIREKNDLQHSLRQAESQAPSSEKAQPQTTAIGTTLSEPKEHLTSPSGLPIADESLALRRGKPSEATDDVNKIQTLLTAERKRAEQLNFQLAGLTREHQELQQAMDQAISDVKAEIRAEYETEISSLRATVEDNRILTDDIENDVIISSSDKNIAASTQKPDQAANSADHTILQDKLFDVAAAITKLTVTIEGDDSVIHELLAKEENETENSLSHRIQRLMEAVNEAQSDNTSETFDPAVSSEKTERATIKPVTRKIRVQVPAAKATKKAKVATNAKAETRKKTEPQLPVTDPETKTGAKKLSLPKAEGFVVSKKAGSDA